MDPLVASLVGRWVIESEKVAKEDIFTFTYMQTQLPQDHFCILELAGVCPGCESNWELEDLFKEQLEIYLGALLGNFLQTCCAAVEHQNLPADPI